MATFNATIGADALSGTGADDTFVFTAGTAEAGDSVAGNAGTDTLEVRYAGGSGDYRFDLVTLSSIETLTFNATTGGAVTAYFLASQFGGGQIANSLQVSAVAGASNAIRVTLASPGTFSAGAWVIGGAIGTGVTLDIFGSSGNDSLTGLFSTGTTFHGGAGSNTMTGGFASDTFVYSSPSDAGGGAVAGGGGQDTLSIDVAGITVNFTAGGSTFNSISRLSFDPRSSGGETSFVFNSSHFGGGLISNSVAINGSNLSLRDSVEVVLNGAASFSAAGWTFTNFSGPDFVAITGSAGADTLTGASVASQLRGGGGDDTITGGGSDDLLDGGAGNDALDGAGGADMADYSLAAGAVTVNLGVAGPQNTVNAGTDTLISIEQVRGTSFNDTLTGSGGDNLLDGGAGNDTLTGGGGNDTYGVDSASDVVSESANQGDDTVRTTLASFNLGATAGSANVENLAYVGAGNFVGVGGALAGTLTGGAGNDTLIGSQAGGALFGADGNDVLWFYGTTALQGGAGFDHAIQLDTTAQTRALGATGIEVYIGNVSSDTIDNIGGAAFSILYGGGGNDTITQGAVGGFIFGQDGSDLLIGGAGADTLIGNAEGDRLFGNGGNDVLYIDVTDGINFNGGDGIDYAIVEGTGDGTFALFGKEIEVFVANNGNDQIEAGLINSAMGLYGFGGNDRITGPDLSSQLFGQDGDDRSAPAGATTCCSAGTARTCWSAISATIS